MKKVVLALGSALMLLATSVQAEETMSFGVKGGGSFFMPTVKEVNGDKNSEGKLNMFVGGGLFFDYAVLEDLSVGIELGYSRKGLRFGPTSSYVAEQEKEANKKITEDAKKEALEKVKKTKGSRIGVHIHALDIAMPVSFFPMGREEGLSIFAGPKFYIALSENEFKYVPGATKPAATKPAATKPAATKPVKEPRTMNTFNIGATAGVEYEIAETGFFVGASYEVFFLDTFNSNKEGKAMKKGLVGEDKKDKTFYTHGAQAFVGFDFASLLN